MNNQPDVKQLNMEAAQATLLRVFGYEQFRPLQADIISRVLQKQDALVVMPTGSGKSLCYQLPALLFDGLTVVVSPLISLMQDQVQQLQALGITAVTLNSTIIPEEYGLISNQVRSGQAKLLYVAPETLLQPHIQALLSECSIDCFTIDEAHCISEWGHDFRPEYRQLAAVRARFENATCLAVTATATEQVRQDIQHSLGLSNANTFLASFDRHNLHLAVTDKQDGLMQTVQFIKEHSDQSGIVYCSTRKQVEVVSTALNANGFNSLPYHAGLPEHVRADNQRRFIRDDVPIMVATIAFGMGINKSNIRFIVHYDLPKNLESYYQQIGRAGRDGLPADCLLLFSYSDVRTIQYFIGEQADSQQVGAQLRLKGMLGFAETAVCRRRPLLEYFGEA
ncbi:MAG: ATP-dependent DNA helicase RecQ, partial [Chloroflexota bacterium]